MVPLNTEVFLPPLMTMREKQTLAKAGGIQKELIWGSHSFFSVNIRNNAWPFFPN